MTTKTQRLIEERCRILDGPDACRATECQRVRKIDRKLVQLAQRAKYAKAHRETMFDINGHHGRA